MNYFHPLPKFETIQTETGPKQVMNTWAFASIIWSEVRKGNPNASKMALNLFSNSIQFDLLLAQNNEAADREAIAIIATVIDEKVSEAFQS